MTKRSLKKILWVGIVLILANGHVVSLASTPRDPTHYFPQTGYEIDDLFYHYWQESGGLSQNGYPISPTLQERSDFDGRIYVVQYFERSLLEHHKENQPPFDILAAHLGVIRYNQLYGQQHTPVQTPNKSAGSVLFPEMGKRLGGPFLEYWMSHGGLMQKGYPISDEFMEISALDGKPYRVQYFERAVFELHPENRAPNDVLLSQLGRYAYERRQTIAPQPTSTAAVMLPHLLSETSIGTPAAGGHYIFWTDVRNPQMAIYGYDLNTSQEFLVKQLPLGAASLATDGQTLVWVEGTAQSGDSIQSYDLATKRLSTIVPSGTNEYDHIAIDAGTLFYEKSGTGLVAHVLATGQERLISASGSAPIATEGKLLWTELKQQCPPNDLCSSQWELYLSDSANIKSKTLLATSSGPNGFRTYNASGNQVVWADAFWSDGFTLYDVRNSTSRTIRTQGISEPIVSGNIIVWSEGPTGGPQGPKGWSIKGYDMSTNTSWKIIPEGNSFLRPSCIISGKTLLFTDADKLYLTELDH
jgi:hypothetical protein